MLNIFKLDNDFPYFKSTVASPDPPPPSVWKSRSLIRECRQQLDLALT